jgi:DNA-binding SARP family transcriptional activator/TolB-like protein/cytochrome c-type biogenesis protein CcmH/NrfG
MNYRLALFGSPRLTDADGQLISLPAKAFPVAAFLLLSGAGPSVTRQVLAQLLWTESDSAGTNLRQLLRRVRTRQDKAGVALIRTRANFVELDQSAVEIDVARFLALAAEGGRANAEELCWLYRGDLLADVAGEGSEFREWHRVQQAHLRNAFISAVVGAVEPVERNADHRQIQVLARRLIEVDPFQEAAHRALMLIAAEAGATAEARTIYLRLKARLRDELGTEPETATNELFQRLTTPRPATAEARPAAEPLPETPIIPRAARSRTGTPKIAILTPAKAGTDVMLGTLADALVEDITIGLCRFKALSVIAPYTAGELSGNASQEETFRRLGIDYVVEARLHRRDSGHTLSVKLVNERAREIVWAEQYSFEPGDVARRYRELSIRLVMLLTERIERSELASYDIEQDPDAYHWFLVGQRWLRALDLPSIRKARRAFKTALTGCPDFVPALSGMARALQLEWLLLARGDPELLNEAEELAQRAVTADPDDARGYRELGICHLFNRRYDESKGALAEGEMRNPQFADLLTDFADTLVHSCEPAPALDKIERAISLNPLGPDQYWWTAAGVNYQLKRYQTAVECIERMRDQSPAYRLMAASCAMQGDRGRARSFVRKAKSIHPDFKVRNWLSVVPLRDPGEREHYEQGLRLAGFE